MKREGKQGEAGVMRVLIVEDNRGAAVLLCRMLAEEESGAFLCAAATTLSEAIAHVQQHPTDAVVLDLGLPDSQGPVTVERLRAIVPKMPVVVVSGEQGDEVVHEAMARGAQDYLLKGQFGGGVLRRALRYAVDSKRAECALESSRQELKALYEEAPVLLCTLDAGRRVLYANRAFTEFTGVAEGEMREGRACGVFGCINAADDPRGCGFGVRCRDCRLRQAIEDTCATGRPHREVEYRATLDRQGVRRDVVLLGSTVCVPGAEGHRVLLCLQDVSPRVRAEAALRESEERIRSFARRLLSAREDERRRIAAVLHHELGSMAVGLSARLGVAEDRLRAGRTQAAWRALAATRCLLDNAVARLKAVSVELRPPDLDVLGLPVALREHFARVREGGVAVRFTDGTRGRTIPADAATVLFRVAQESLTNVAKHAGVGRATVRLDALATRVRITVRDSGAGFDVAEAATRTRGMGLRTLREMVASLGGSVDIRSTLGRGTQIRATVPAKRDGADTGGRP